MRGVRIVFAFTFALALSAWSQRAASQVAEVAPPLTLDWSAPAGCPSREHVLARVEAILGHSPKPRRALAVRAIAAQSSSGKWRVRLAADREGVGNRELETESCDAAADATALIVSLLIDPAVAGSEDIAVPPAPEKTAPPAAATPAPSPPRESLPAPSAGSPPPDSPAPSVGSPRAPLFAVRASVAGDVGTFSAANVGGELALALSPSRFRFELAGSYWLSATASLGGSPPEGARLELATLGVRAAYVFSAGDLALAPLLGIEGDRMSAAGFGGTSQQNQTASWVALDAGATGFWLPFRALPPLHALALTLTLEAVVAAEKLSPFVATASGGATRIVEQSSQVAPRAFVGVEGRFF